MSDVTVGVECSKILNKSISFLDKLDELLRKLPKCDYPGKYIWTPYGPQSSQMSNLARKLNKTEYYGIAVPEHHLDAIESIVDGLTTEMIECIERNTLLRKKVIENQYLRNIRFLLNRDIGNRPVMWFSSREKYYSVFLNPNTLIPKKIEES